VASTKFYNIFGDSNAARIAGVCMGLLQLLIGGGREPADSLSYTRDRVDRASDASRGKALWALGYVVSRSRLLHSAAANDLLQELGSSWKPATIMGRAYGILGAANYLMHFSGASEVRRTLSRSADELAKACEADPWIQSVRNGRVDGSVGSRRLAGGRTGRDRRGTSAGKRRHG
jgi:hypothetical protein